MHLNEGIFNVRYAGRKTRAVSSAIYSEIRVGGVFCAEKPEDMLAVSVLASWFYSWCYPHGWLGV
jgi:hypothetical protein